jgi:hypothetical protein
MIKQTKGLVTKSNGIVDVKKDEVKKIICQCGQKLGTANFSKVTHSYFCPNCCTIMEGKDAGVEG